MTLRSASEDDEYRPEYGLLQIRDIYEPGRHDGPDDVVDGLAALEENVAVGFPFGTVALAGVAWLQARATDEYHRVRLDAHDAAPPEDTADWAAVMETPYFCRTGAVYLTRVTGTSEGATIPVGIGLSRVRVSHRPADDEGQVWRLQFWPDPTMQPSRWHKRAQSAGTSARGGDASRESVAGDLISLLLWTGSSLTTVAALARQLHAGVDAVRAAIRDQLDRHVRIDAGDLNDPGRPIVLAVQPRPTVPPAAEVRPPAPVPQPGPPWQPVPAAAEVRPRLDERGQLYAVVEWHLGRRNWFRLHLVDLADGTRRIMPWDESQDLALNAVHDGVVRFNTTMQWRPGHDPEPAPYPLSTIEPVSGTALHFDPQGPVVISPDGTSRRPAAGTDARLVPGGRQMYEFGHAPPSLVLYDTATGRTTQTYWLPSGTEVSRTTPQHPIWEDRTHLLLHVPRGVHEIGASVVRLDITTGQFEGVPLRGDQPEYARLVQPLL